MFSAFAARSAGGPPSTSTETTFAERVHAGVRAAGDGEVAERLVRLRERVADGGLDGRQARLRRPAAERRAVVLDR